ncbi:unnamed protein product, partial [Aureobasidium vineae]
MTETNETTSLLTAHECENGRVESHRHGTSHADSNSDQPVHSEKTTVVLCGLFIILFQFADILRFAPSLHLLELGYCRDYYHEHDPRLIDPVGQIPERFCKVREIQEDLSSIRAWLGFVEGLVDFAQDAHCFEGFFWKTFPIDAIVISPMLRAVGGGAPVASAVILAIVASAVPASKRSSAFFLMGAAELVTEMIMPLVSTAFLSNGFVYTPILLGFVFEGLALLAIYHVPVDTCIAHSGERLPTNAQRNDGQHASQTSFADVKSDRLKYL